MATYAIGDIQGCYDSLEALLKTIKFSAQDRLWVAGDLVNRGPKSFETLEFLHGIGDQVEFVLGNHDLSLLAIAYGHATPSRSDTITPLLNHPKCDPLLEWLQTGKVLAFNQEFNCLMTHAGIPHIWSSDKAFTLAKELEDTLQGKQANAYFKRMYGNQPKKWDDELSGQDRLRCITNYFTRMRFCKADAKLEFKHTDNLSTAPAGYKAWFDYHNPNNPYPIIFGHWASLEGYTGHENAIALDTGCVWGDQLTALRLDDNKRFSVDACDTY